MDIRVRLAETDSDLERLAPVLLELRAQFTAGTLIARIKEQQKHGYMLAVAESGSEIVGVAGFVVGIKLAWGRHIYVDDLVIAERYRSSGVGTALIESLKGYASDHGCGQIHLGSGVERFSAHRFYLRHGFNITSHHFSMRGIGAASDDSV